MRSWGIEVVFQLVLFLVFAVIQGLAVARVQDPARPGGTNWIMTLDSQSGGSFKGATGSVEATGRVDDLDVRIGLVADSKQRIGVTCSGLRLHPQLSIRPEGFFGNRDLQTGDDAFDRRFALGGPPHVLAAVLSRDLRNALMSLADRNVRVHVRSGEVELSRMWDRKDAVGLGSAAKEAASLLPALAVQPGELSRDLAERAVDRREPTPLRVLAADCLFGRAPSSEDAAVTALALLAEGQMDLALAVGRGLARTHSGARERMVQIARNDTEGKTHRVEAVAILGRLGDASLRPLFDALIASSPPEVRAAAVQAVAQLGGGAAGGLALAEGDAGAVAVVAETRGAVAIKE